MGGRFYGLGVCGSGGWLFVGYWCGVCCVLVVWCCEGFCVLVVDYDGLVVVDGVGVVESCGIGCWYVFCVLCVIGWWCCIVLLVRLNVLLEVFRLMDSLKLLWCVCGVDEWVNWLIFGSMNVKWCLFVLIGYLV